MTKSTQYKEGQEVRTDHYIADRGDGSDWPIEQIGTLMKYLGDGDWLVYVPGHGSPMVNEREFV